MLALSFIAFLLFGWVWGDAWVWNVVRAAGATLCCLGIGVLFAATSRAARVTRVVLGVIVAGWCASVLGGGKEAVLVSAGAFFVVLLGCEYLISHGTGREVSER